MLKLTLFTLLVHITSLVVKMSSMQADNETVKFHIIKKCVFVIFDQTLKEYFPSRMAFLSEWSFSRSNQFPAGKKSHALYSSHSIFRFTRKTRHNIEVTSVHGD